MTRNAKWGCGALLGVALLGAIIGAIHGEDPDAKARHVGSRAVLRTEGNVPIGLAADEAAFDEMMRAGVAGDLAGFGELIRAGRMAWIRPGTAVVVIDMAVYKRRVRVLDGPYAGVAGWVPYERVVAQ